MILGNKVLQGFLTPCSEDSIREAGLDLKLKENLVLQPKEFKLIWTKEIIKLPTKLLAFCNLRSSWARKGILIPPTIIDPGFEGRIVIEVFNASDNTISIPSETRFLHVILAEVNGAIPYCGQYQNQGR